MINRPCKPLLCLVVVIFILLLSACSTTGLEKDGRPAVFFGIPSVTPDGNSIFFSFSYPGSKEMIGVVPTDPNLKSVSILELPGDINWQSPVVSLDMDSLALVSKCIPKKEGDTCFDNAIGFHVWKSSIDGGGLKRLTPDRGKIGHANPAFGETSDEVFYTTGFATERIGIIWDGPVRYRPSLVVLNKGGKEEPIFPQKSEHGMWSHGSGVWNIRLMKYMRKNDFLFSAVVNDDNIYSLKLDPKYLSGSEFVSNVPLRYRNGKISIRRQKLFSTLASNGEPGVEVFRKSLPTDPPSAGYYLSESGKERLLFSQVGTIIGLSVSNDLKKYAILMRRMVDDYRYTIWLYDDETGELIDLKVRERLLQQAPELFEQSKK